MDMLNAGAIVEAAMDKIVGLLADMPASSGSFTVNKDNVLAAAKIIQTQADHLRDTLDDPSLDLWMVLADDVVSKQAAAAWNDRLIAADDSILVRIQQYIDGLKNLVRQLGDTAKTYGHTDEEIAAAIGAQSA